MTTLTGSALLGLAVAHGHEAQPHARAQAEIDRRDGRDGERDRQRIGAELARLAGQREHGLERATGAAAERGRVGDEQAIDLGDRPRADGEVPARESEDERRGRQREGGGDEARQRDGQEGVHAEIVGKHVLEGIGKAVQGREPEHSASYAAEDALSRP